MVEDNIAFAKSYYNAFNNKDIEAIARHLHPDVHFVAPMGESTGIDDLLGAATRLIGVLKSITIRASFGAGDQVMLAYDLNYGEPIGICRVAVLMNFKEGLIARIELFYDARPFGNL
jgi:ketosteroid isomerase-like protein